MVFSENKHAIDQYLKNNDCVVGKHPVVLQGQLKEIDVYALPLNYLYYNIKNGRFKAEYLELVKNNGGKTLEPKNSDDAKIIQRMLFANNLNETKITMSDIRSLGQRTPGIITHDGFLIDGNRRYAILSELAKTDTKFKIMNVARLSSGIKTNDLWKIEAGIQLGKVQILQFDPINEMLKLQQGLDEGFEIEEMADILYGSDHKEIKRKLKILKLIENYLTFIGLPKQYTNVKNRIAHFEELNEIMIQTSKNIDDPELRKNIKFAVFILISEKIGHKEIRKIISMIKIDSKNALEYITKIAKMKKYSMIGGSDNTSSTQKNDVEDSRTDDDDRDSTPVSTMFYTALDILMADQDKHNITKLLDRAFTNLDKIDYTSDELTTDDSRDKIEKILRCSEKLRARFDGH